MRKTNSLLILGAFLAAAFQAGRWYAPAMMVKADDGGVPQADVRQIGGSSSLVVYYPDLKKMYVYQPFAGPPSWPCAYSIQLSSPGGRVERQACQDSE